MTEPHEPSATFEHLEGGGVTGALIRSIDWASTGLGPVAGWPRSLLVTVETLLHSRHPMFLWWGPDLVQFYNDAYLPSFGIGKHPAAMGQAGRDCWGEIWPIIGPQIEGVMSRGTPTWHEDALVPILRNDRIEEVYWTYGYSPIIDDDRRIGGVLVICTETTGRVLAARRQRVFQTIADSSTQPDASDSVERVLACITEAAEDVPFMVRLDTLGLVVTISGPVERPDVERLAQLVRASDAPHRATLLELSLQPIQTTRWPEPVTQAFAVPLRRGGSVVFGVSARLSFNQTYRDFLLQIVASIEAAHDRADAAAVRAAADLQRANLYRHFMQAPFPIAVFKGPAHVVELANPEILAVWGKGHEVVGQPLLVGLPELRGQPFPAWLDGVYRTGVAYDGKEQLALLPTGPNGALEEVYCNFVYAPLRDTAGVVEGVLVSAFIVTDQVRAKHLLKEAVEERALALVEAERVSRAKDEFVATMSHELRTPLNAILGWAQILRDAPSDATKLARGIAVIERNAEAQARLISDLLDVSRIISGKLRLTVKRISIAAATHAAIDVVRPAAEAKGVTLVTEIDPHTGELVADPDRLQQIVWNLLSNAVKFTQSGGTVTVTAQRVESRIRLRVSDTGAGIEPRHLPVIFDRFRQVDGSTTRVHGGLGLGLAIVRHLAEAHGGTVTAHSAGLGMGAAFTVELPVHAVHTSEEQTLQRVTPRDPDPTSRRGIQLRGVTVLLVDDEEDSLDLLCMVLEDAGAVVTSARTAREALAHAARSRFHLVISDIGMPEMDGYSLMRQLRGQHEGGDVPAIALTAYARAEDAEQAMRAGFQKHVTKPVDAAALLAIVERTVRR